MQLILLLFLIPLVFSRTLFDPHNTHPHSVLPPPHHYRSLSNNFAVTYIGSPPSDVQAAVAAAATLLSSFLNTNAVFQVSVVWEDVSYIAGLLGEGGPSTQCHHPDSTHFEHALVVPSLYAENGWQVPVYDTFGVLQRHVGYSELLRMGEEFFKGVQNYYEFPPLVLHPAFFRERAKDFRTSSAQEVWEMTAEPLLPFESPMLHGLELGYAEVNYYYCAYLEVE